MFGVKGWPVGRCVPLLKESSPFANPEVEPLILLYCWTNLLMSKSAFENGILWFNCFLLKPFWII